MDRLTEETPDARAAALALVLRYPENDGPRLVFAEWCERNGEEDRAAFVWIQCVLARAGAREVAEFGGRRVSVAALRKRERELLTAMLDTGTPERRARTIASWVWSDGVFGPDVAVIGRQFRRGFIESVSLTSAQWVARGDAIVAAHPVRNVRLADEPNERELGTIEGMDWVVGTATYYRWPGVTFQLPNRRTGALVSAAPPPAHPGSHLANGNAHNG